MSLEKNKVVWRRCIGCGERFPKESLTRFCLKDGVLTPDPDFRGEGRGAYLCGKPACTELAIKKKAFNRTLRTNVADPSDIIRRWFDGNQDI